jgi:hypothetical protein
MPTNADYRTAVIRYIEPIATKPGEWWAEIHSYLRDGIEDHLERCLRHKAAQHVVVVYGMHGTPIDRIGQVLADYLRGGSRVLPGYHTVLELSLMKVRSMAATYETRLAAVEGLNAAMARAVKEQAILLLTDLEALDGGAEVDEALAGELAAPGNALVVALYTEEERGSTNLNSGILSSQKIMKIPAEFNLGSISLAKRTRNVLHDHFLPHWDAELRCVFEENAFDTVIALEPFAERDGHRLTLPYLAIYPGRDACDMVTLGTERVLRRVSEAKFRLAALREQTAADEELQGYFDLLWGDIEADLTALEAEPIKHDTRNSKKIVRRGHVIAEVLGDLSYQVRLPSPEQVPGLPQLYPAGSPSLPSTDEPNTRGRRGSDSPLGTGGLVPDGLMKDGPKDGKAGSSDKQARS